jgi:hypothetical protein
MYENTVAQPAAGVVMHRPETHMYPVGYPLHPNEENEERNLRRRASAVVVDRSLADQLRSPYLAPERHQLPERDRLPFRRDRA